MSELLPDRATELKNAEAERVNLVVNGETRCLPAGTTLAQLLETLQLDPRTLAVELNRDVVPRGRHALCVLQEGDRLEIVTLVGGG